MRQAAPGHTTAATRSARPTHSPALSYRARCGGPIGLLTLCDAPTFRALRVLHCCRWRTRVGVFGCSSSAAMSPRPSSRHRAASGQRCLWSAAVGNPTCVGAAAAGLRGVLPRVTFRKPSMDHHAVAGPEARWRHHRWWQRLAMIAALADIGRCKLGPVEAGAGRFEAGGGGGGGGG